MIESSDILSAAVSLNGKWVYVVGYSNEDNKKLNMKEGYECYVFDNGTITEHDENQSGKYEWDLYAAKQNGVLGLYVHYPQFQEGKENYQLITNYTDAADDQLVVHWHYKSSYGHEIDWFKIYERQD